VGDNSIPVWVTIESFGRDKRSMHVEKHHDDLFYFLKYVKVTRESIRYTQCMTYQRGEYSYKNTLGAQRYITQQFNVMFSLCQMPDSV
jgi:hypothetical protein